MRQQTKSYGKKQRDLLTREIWLDVAYQTLVNRGVDNVKILTLADKLGVTRGSFYWRFESREDLLQNLIEIWRRTNATALLKASNSRPTSLGEWYVNLMRVWLDASQFDVQLDVAVRDWARKDQAVWKQVEHEDKVRIGRFRLAFMEIGKLEERVAFTRARILYFQQMGYYMIGAQDPPELRSGYLSEYCVLLTGEEIDSRRVDTFVNEVQPLIG